MLYELLTSKLDSRIQCALNSIDEDVPLEEKYNHIIRGLSTIIVVLLVGFISLAVTAVMVKMENKTLTGMVKRVNTILDYGNPESPLNMLLLMNNDSIKKIRELHDVEQQYVEREYKYKILIVRGMELNDRYRNRLKVCKIKFEPLEQEIIDINDEMPEIPPDKEDRMNRLLDDLDQDLKEIK